MDKAEREAKVKRAEETLRLIKAGPNHMVALAPRLTRIAADVLELAKENEKLEELLRHLDHYTRAHDVVSCELCTEIDVITERIPKTWCTWTRSRKTCAGSASIGGTAKFGEGNSDDGFI